MDTSTAQRLLRDFRWDDLSHDELVVLSALRGHMGRATAVSVPDLAARVGMAPRRAQQVVKDLVERHGIPVGSTSASDRPGWFLCATDEERAEARRSLTDRALSILRRAKAFSPRQQPRLAVLYAAQQPLPFRPGDDHA